MKKFNYLLAVIAIIVTLSGCKSATDKARDQLRDEISEANLSCPIDMGIMGQITSIDYDDDTNAVQYIVEYNESFITPESLSQNEEKVRSNMLMSLNTGNGPEQIAKMVDAEASLDFIFRGATTGAEKIFHYSTDDLRAAQESTMTEEENYQTILANTISTEKEKCPQKLDEGFYMTDVYDDGNNVVYVYSMDDDMYEVSALNDISDSIKEGIIEEISAGGDPVMSRLITILKNLDKGLVYRYVGTPGGAIAEVYIAPYEL